ncbi:MAG: glucosamine-6-phosphate deaminase [Clostridia bacterium]
MKIIICKSYDEISKRAAEMIKDTVKTNPSAVLGLATGSSPLGIYDCLTKAYAKGEISFKDVKSINLDEYIGLSALHNQSYRYFMNEKLFSHIDIKQENTHFPNGVAKDLKAECIRYNTLLKSLVPDLQLLGLGENGHIGFNEPGAAFDGTVDIVTLNESTIAANARFFASKDEVPTQAITMGIKNILDAKSIVLVAMTTKKAQAVYNMVKADISVDCPASALRTHNDVTIFLDEGAASLL